MYYCDYDFPEFYEVRDIKKSRKEHPCCECNETISIGSSYVYIAGVWDQNFRSYKQHQECAEACRAVRDEEMNSEGCIPFGYYTEWLSDSFAYRKNWKPRTRKALASLCIKRKTIRDTIKDWLVS